MRKTKSKTMEGVTYLVDAQNKTIAIQLDFKKYGELVEELLDVLEAEAYKNDETITLEELKEELKREGKL